MDGVEPTAQAPQQHDPRAGAAHLLRVAEAALAGVLVFLAVATLFGVVLGMAERHGPLAVGLAALLGGLVAFVLWLRAAPPARVGRRHLVAIGAIWLVALGSGAYDATLSAQHVVVEEDAGVYATAGEWLSNTGRHNVVPERELFSSIPEAQVRSQGYETVEGSEDVLFSQYLDGLPSLLALADGVGGSWLLFKTVPLLGIVAILAVGALAMRIAGPLVGVLAALVLAVNPLQSFFSRDTWSEVPTQLFIVGGLWMLIRAWDGRRPELAALGGLVLAGSLAVRPDAYLALIPVAIVIAAGGALGASAARRRRGAALLGAYLAAVVIGATIAFVDLRSYASWYDQFIVGDDVRQLIAVNAGLAIAGVVIVVLAIPSSRAGRSARAATERLASAARRRPSFAIGLGTLVAVAGLLVAFVRPHVQTTRNTDLEDNGRDLFLEAIQEDSGVALDGTRLYAEEFFAWAGWYAGAPFLVAAALGLGVAFGALALRPRLAWWLPLLVFLVLVALYFSDPLVTPYQIFATRRLVPIILPGLAILAAIAIAQLVFLLRRPAVRSWLARRGVRPTQARRGGVVLAAIAALVVLVPSAIGLSKVDVRVQVPGRVLIEATCDQIEPTDVVVVAQSQTADQLPGESQLVETLPHTIRSFCEVPVAGNPAILGVDRYRSLAGELAAAGRGLVVLSARPNPFAEAENPLGSQLIFDYEAPRLRRVVEEPAEERDAFPVSVYLSRVSAAPA